MIYFVENKSTGEFHFVKGYDGIGRVFPVLKKKRSTIINKFIELKKNKDILSYSRWGFIIKASSKIE